MTPGRHVLVTGSSGRIGAAICRVLADGHRVTGLDRVPGAATTLVGDAADSAVLARALHGVDAVVHVAALHAPHVGTASEAEFERINVEGVQRLAALAAAFGVARIVYTSTTALYGDASTPPGRAGWVDEDLAPLPRTVYHRSKLAAERVLRAAACHGGVSVRILRMSRCFPEPLPLMAQYRLHRGVDERDVALAHALALDHAGGPCETFVVSAPTPLQREDCEQLLRDAPAVLRRRAPSLVRAFAQRGWPLPPSIDRVYDPARAIAALAWTPRHGFEDLLVS